MNTTKEAVKERIAAFCENPFFQQYPSMVVTILEHEIKTGIKVPNRFDITVMPLYQFGERQIMLAKIYNFFIIGMDFENGYWEFKSFESKRELKMFFGRMEGLERTEIAQWLTEADKLPD